MVERVYRCAEKSAAEKVVVATDDARIYDVVSGFGGEVLMTSAEHPSGTDRLQEVASVLALEDDSIVVNVQGDEPTIPAAVINQVAENLVLNAVASVATLSEPVVDVETVFNPNAVKVVADNAGLALYFSRAGIPWLRGSFDSDCPVLPGEPLVQRHVGIYAYRARLLHEFIRWPESELEKCERLEQLRILSNGHRIHVAPACQSVPGGVDTLDDLVRVRRLLERERMA